MDELRLKVCGRKGDEDEEEKMRSKMEKGRCFGEYS